MTWERYDSDKEYEDGSYMVMCEGFYNYPINAFPYLGYFMLNLPNLTGMPSMLPIVVTHVYKIPKFEDIDDGN